MRVLGRRKHIGHGALRVLTSLLIYQLAQFSCTHLFIAAGLSTLLLRILWRRSYHASILSHLVLRKRIMAAINIWWWHASAAQLIELLWFTRNANWVLVGQLSRLLVVESCKVCFEVVAGVIVVAILRLSHHSLWTSSSVGSVMLVCQAIHVVSWSSWLVYSEAAADCTRTDTCAYSSSSCLPVAKLLLYLSCSQHSLSITLVALKVLRSLVLCLAHHKLWQHRFYSDCCLSLTWLLLPLGCRITIRNLLTPYRYILLFFSFWPFHRKTKVICLFSINTCLTAIMALRLLWQLGMLTLSIFFILLVLLFRNHFNLGVAQLLMNLILFIVEALVDDLVVVALLENGEVLQAVTAVH